MLCYWVQRVQHYGQLTRPNKHRPTSPKTLTGVLAFRGLGHVKSIDKTSRFSANQRLMFRRGRNGKELKFQFRKNSDFLELTSDVNKSLFSQNSRGVSIVERGQYSATFHESRPVSMPVKINPIQFTLLYRNTYLDMTLYSKDSSSSDLESTRATYPLVGDILAPKDQAASYRGQYSLAQRKYAPKAGGLVDLRTGIYVPPEANAIFNEIYKVYVPKGVGRLNAVNGNYVPIKNLKLDNLTLK